VVGVAEVSAAGCTAVGGVAVGVSTADQGATNPLLSAVDAVSELASTTAAIVVPSLIPYVSPVGASLLNSCD
jgi:hypothetical protein